MGLCRLRFVNVGRFFDRLYVPSYRVEASIPSSLLTIIYRFREHLIIIMMYQEFFIGQSADERCRKIDISAFETLQHLKTSLGRLFSFADPNCEFCVTTKYSP